MATKYDNFRSRLNQFLDKNVDRDSTLSTLINKKPSSVSDYRSGKTKFPMDVVLGILQYYPDLSAEWLMRGEGPMIKSNTSHTNVSSISGGNNSFGTGYRIEHNEQITDELVRLTSAMAQLLLKMNEK